MMEVASNHDLVDALVSFLPPAVARTIRADPRPLAAPQAERFPAAVLLADVSGFTALTGELAALGGPGVEELTALVNRYFARMIGLLEAAGGEVVQFSGDALMAVFPAPGPPDLPAAAGRAAGVAEQMQAAMPEFAALQTSVGERGLAMKVAIGAGEVLAISVGGIFQRWQYIITGDPLRQVGEAEQIARRGEIVLSPQARALLAASPPLPAAPVATPPLDWSQADGPTLEALRAHIPRAVTARLDSGQAGWLAELRRMSVVFLGVGGLESDNLDHFQAAVRALQEVTYRYEGSINKFQVDDKGVIGIVLFGAPPLAHPDDPLRAARFALDLRRAAGDQGLPLAVGITTGQVFAGPVGSPSRREYTVMGDVVNTAARLMQAAGPGGVLCDHSTYRAASAELRWEELPPLTLKGKAAPVRAYRPTGLASAADARSARRGDGRPLVGREGERAAIEAALAELEARASRALLIEGEEGIGKSRLVGELVRLARARGLSGLLGTAEALERETPYNAWREIFGSYFDLEPLRGAEERRAQILGRLAQIAPDLAERAPLLNDLLALDLPESALTAGLEPERRQAALSALLVELLRLWAAEHPLLLVLEDAHWLDPLGWELAALLGRALADLPLLLVLVRRPAEQGGPDPAAEVVARPNTIRIALGPLDQSAAAQVAAGRIGVDRLADDLTDLIGQRAAGNPLVIEELALSLRDGGALLTREGAAGLRADPAELQLPDSLQSMVLSRLDLLPADVQLTLKVAAVIGASFSRELLGAVYPAPTGAALIERHLDSLTERELIVALPSGGEVSHRFRQAVLQEMTYSTILPTQRRALHASVGAWYETRPAENLVGNLPQLVHHWRQAGDARRELRYASIAGRRFAGEYANAAALSYLGRALQLSASEAERVDLLQLRLQIYERTGEREAQRADLERLDALVRPGGGPVELARLENTWACYHRDLSNYPAALTYLDAALVAARQAGHPVSEAHSLTLLGEVREIQGELADARGCFERALAAYRAIGYRRGEANNLGRLGNLHYFQGDFTAARDLFLQTLELRRATYDADECVTLNNLAEAEVKLGNWAAARNYWQQALVAARRVGNRGIEGLALGQLGYAALAQGDYRSALDQLSRSVRIFQIVGDRRREAATLNDLGMLYRDIGDVAGAKASFERALASQDAIGDAPNAAFTALNLGRLLIAEDPSAATALYRRALDYALGSGERETEAYARSYLAHLTEHHGNLAAAEDGYRAAVELRGELDMCVAEDEAGLARVALARTDVAAALVHARAALAEIETEGVDNLEFPLLVYLSCHDALRAAGLPAEAAGVLAAAHGLLTERAASVDDPSLRAAMLERVPINRRVVELWRAARS